MPFKSSKQRAFFGMCKAGKATTKKCPPANVVEEFFRADKMKRLGKAK